MELKKIFESELQKSARRSIVIPCADLKHLIGINKRVFISLCIQIHLRLSVLQANIWVRQCLYACNRFNIFVILLLAKFDLLSRLEDKTCCSVQLFTIKSEKIVWVDGISGSRCHWNRRRERQKERKRENKRQQMKQHKEMKEKMKERKWKTNRQKMNERK